jgi:hypothetical protein
MPGVFRPDEEMEKVRRLAGYISKAEITERRKVMKTFTVAGVNYDVATDGVTFTIAQEGQPAMFSQAFDKAKTPAEAMSEVLVSANTFLVDQFPNLSSQFVEAILALFETLVINVVDGVPTIAG